MASKAVDVDVGPRKGTWRDFLYDSDKGTVLGRTGISWFKITVFYIIFYACLAGWFAGLLHAFYKTLDDRAPRYYGEDSLLQANPALGLRPMPLFDSTLIRFAQGKSSSYRPYTDHLEAFLKIYDNVNNTVDCSSAPAPTDKSCMIKIRDYMTALGCTRDNDYGYQQGSPCVVIKMNKIYGFEPKPYPTRAELDADLNTEKNERFGHLAYADGNTGISCDGQNAVDKQNIKKISFYPSEGLSTNYFPYTNQEGYRSPVVVARLEDVTKRITIQVTCRVWALNIENSDGKEKRGTVHFEVYID